MTPFSQILESPTIPGRFKRLHVEGDHYVQEAATIGLLEGIQNLWSRAGVDTDLFARHLLPVSARWWQSLQKFWNGESRFVGEGF